MKYVLWLLRIALGATFIFSGLVKANDPLGLTYKMQEVFEVWQMSYLASSAFWLSIGMITFELVAGVAMIVGNSFRLYISLMLWMNIFYTFLTGYALYSGKIKECGCFGDCIKLTNLVTFEKDIALTAINLFLYIFRYRVFPIFNKASVNFSIVTLAAILAGGFQWWVLNHLPYHDCLPYSIGSNLQKKMLPAPGATDDVYESVLTYEKNGVKKDFPSDKIPWQDSSWVYVSTQTKLVKAATGQPEIHDFVLNDSAGNDRTKEILSNKGYTFFWVLRDADKIKMDKNNKPLNMDKLNALFTKAQTMKIQTFMVASIDPALCKTYQEAWDMKFVPFLIIDHTVNKTAMRTNPGLIVLHDGVVEQKWSYRDYPSDMDMQGDKLVFKK